MRTSFQLAKPLRPTNTNEYWENNTITPALIMPIPNNVTLTRSSGIQGLDVTIDEQFSAPYGSGNWSVTGLNVSIFNSPSHCNADRHSQIQRQLRYQRFRPNRNVFW
jgi:hypothetical protein